MKHPLSNKVASNEAITLVEDNNVVCSDKKAETISNKFFSNIIKNIGVYKPVEMRRGGGVGGGGGGNL